MSRVRSGTKALKDGKVLIKSSSRKGPRKMRCPHCKNLVGPTQHTDGQSVYRCTCGRVFRAVTM